MSCVQSDNVVILSFQVSMNNCYKLVCFQSCIALFCCLFLDMLQGTFVTDITNSILILLNISLIHAILFTIPYQNTLSLSLSLSLCNTKQTIPQFMSLKLISSSNPKCRSIKSFVFSYVDSSIASNFSMLSRHPQSLNICVITADCKFPFCIINFSYYTRCLFQHLRPKCDPASR